MDILNEPNINYNTFFVSLFIHCVLVNSKIDDDVWQYRKLPVKVSREIAFCLLIIKNIYVQLQ